MTPNPELIATFRAAGLDIRHRHPLAENVEWLTDAGESPDTIAARLGHTPSSLARALYRAGWPELARPYSRIGRRGAAAQGGAA